MHNQGSSDRVGKVFLPVLDGKTAKTVPSLAIKDQKTTCTEKLMDSA